MIELITTIYWCVFAFVALGIVCLVAYITNPKKWHDIVASMAFTGVIMLGLANLLVWNWSVAI